VNIAGIVCEYNPFHKGHEYQIAETRRILGADSGIVCVMSGDFVQRGEFAVFPKHARAKAAVKCGADLVVELPVPWAAASAEKFALGAVSVLAGSGVCSHLSFGSETGDISGLEETVGILSDPKINEKIAGYLQDGISYAAARQKAAEEIAGKNIGHLKSPNDILAVEYIKAIKALGVNIEPMAVRRIGAKHDGETENGFASASFIRESLLNGEDIKDFLPEKAFSVFSREIEEGRGPVTLENAEVAILSRLRAMTEEEYNSLPENSEGLANRLRKNGRALGSVQEIMDVADAGLVMPPKSTWFEPKLGSGWFVHKF